ncbi:MerR family transcriptional regulator [bacterium]|nr:MerR family transcriptional regulator [bacterium]
MAGPKIRRVYYSSSEICRIADINQNRLLFWERRISDLHPSRNRSGRKCYKPEQLNLLKKIVKFQNVGYSDEKILELLERRSAAARMKTELPGSENVIQEIERGLREILAIINGGGHEY